MPKAKTRRPIVNVHQVTQQPPAASSDKSQQQQPLAAGNKRRRQAEPASHSKRPKQQDQHGDTHHPKQPSTHHGNKGRPKQQGSQHPLTCCSVVDRQAAYALTALLKADQGMGRGATLKSLTLAPHIQAKKATYAVTCQALKYLPILQKVVKHSSSVLPQDITSKVSEGTLYVLLYELLIGQGLHQKGPAERLLLQYKAALKESLQAILRKAKAKSVEELLSQNVAPQPPVHPRWVRVNTLKLTVAEAIQQLRAEFPDVVQDPLLPDVLRLPPGTALHAHPLVTSGALVQQSKASAMPAHALRPQPGWHCVDCCAAPGNKTTHLAARLQGKGRVFAFDKDPKRLQRLQDNCQLTGADQVVQAKLQDFLSVDTADPEYAQVRAVLLDPSCSGSGTVVSRQDHLLPSWQRTQAALQLVRQQHAEMIARGCPLSHSTERTSRPAPGNKVPSPQQVGGSNQGGSEGMGEGSQQRERTPLAEGPESEGDLVDNQTWDGDADRVQQLAKFQVAAVRHALTFPALERLVYSTCSIHAEENELVVQEVLPYAQELGFELEAVFPEWPRRGLPYFPGCEKLVRTDAWEDDTDGFFVAVFHKNVHVPGSVATAADKKTAQDKKSKKHKAK